MHLHFWGQVVLIFWVRSSSFCGSGHSLHLMINKMFIVLVNIRTLLENSTFDVLKYIKVGKNPKVFTTIHFFNPIPYGGGWNPPPKIDFARYAYFCLGNMFFYHLTFKITGINNFWRKKN